MQQSHAIAGLVITFINLIGDGLVSQIPSLIVSMAAGLLVMKAGTTGATDKLIFGQLGKYPQALMMTSIVIGLMAFLPGLPFTLFAMISCIIGAITYGIHISKDKKYLTKGFNTSERASTTPNDIASHMKKEMLLKDRENIGCITNRSNKIRNWIWFNVHCTE